MFLGLMTRNEHEMEMLAQQIRFEKVLNDFKKADIKYIDAKNREIMKLINTNERLFQCLEFIGESIEAYDKKGLSPTQALNTLTAQITYLTSWYANRIGAINVSNREEFESFLKATTFEEMEKIGEKNDTGNSADVTE